MLEKLIPTIEKNMTDEEYSNILEKMTHNVMSKASQPYYEFSGTKVKGMGDRISNLFILIDKGEIRKAETLIKELENEIGGDAILSKAKVCIMRYMSIGK